MKLIFSTLLFSMLSPVFGDHNDDFGWATLSVKIPKSLSDHTASISDTGLVYIAGGCDDKDGNAFTVLNDGEGFFSCGSISDSFYEFDPEDREFQTLANLPRQRYRHSSAIVSNQVWLIGGRDVDDNLIPEVDIYDITAKKWTTKTLPEQYVVSDHASFAQEPFDVYIAGGYDQNYTADSKVNRIVASSVTDDSLAIEERAPLLEARGDITGVSASSGNSAYIGGGFTHENKFCEPLGSTEEYDFASDKWTSLPNLVDARGEIVLVELDNHLYALGGERQIEDICGLTGDTDPGELTVGTEFVEAHDIGSNAWKVVSSFPNHKFRFAAVSVAETGLIYAFGGQTDFDDDCQCFRTSNEVAVFGEGVGSSASYTATIFAAFFAGILGIRLTM